MTITVKFIRRRPGGRITVRPNKFDKRELTIGRGADCDIFLADLRVALLHARLTQASDDKAIIESLSDKRVKADGATVRRREIRISDGETISVGPYDLLIEPGDAPGEMSVSVELVEQLTEQPEPEQAEKAFSLSGGILGKRAAAWALFLAALAAFLIWPIASYFAGGARADRERGDAPATPAIADADRAWLSGALSSSHANLVGDCQACHAEPFIRVQDSTCLSCHDDMLDHARPERLLAAMPAHGGLGEDWQNRLRAALDIPEGRCGSCHFEHNGPTGAIPREQALCVDCHGDLDQRLGDTALQNASDFRRAHPEFRPTVITDTTSGIPSFARISISDNPRENSGLVYPHDFHLDDPEVARRLESTPSARAKFGETLDCADCHALDAGGVLFEPIEMEAHCEDCHSLVFAVSEAGEERLLPHGKPREVVRVLNDFYLASASELALETSSSNVLTRQLGAEDRERRDRLREQAYQRAQSDALAMATRVFSDEGICAKCHEITPPAEGGDPRLYDVKPVIFSDPFMPKAHFPHEDHMTGEFECADCHAAETSSDARDVLLPGIATCRECHGGETDRRLIASPCLTCHIYHAEDGAPPMTPRTRNASRDRSSP